MFATTCTSGCVDSGFYSYLIFTYMGVKGY